MFGNKKSRVWSDFGQVLVEGSAVKVGMDNPRANIEERDQDKWRLLVELSRVW